MDKHKYIQIQGSPLGVTIYEQGVIVTSHFYLKLDTFEGEEANCHYLWSVAVTTVTVSVEPCSKFVRGPFGRWGNRP